MSLVLHVKELKEKTALVLRAAEVLFVVVFAELELI